MGQSGVGLRRASRAQPTIAHVSITVGNGVQVVGMFAGVALLRVAGSSERGALVRLSGLIGGWLTTYLSTHAIAHWAVGRACGIEFRGYRVIVGTANPEQYPTVMRPVMTRLPFWAVRTVAGSGAAHARAAMFAAGETASSLANLFVAAYVLRRRVPVSRGIALVLVVWTVLKTIATTRNERGDYAKALRALRRQ
jgi:hypothetical protein